MTIPASQIVQINPTVISAGGSSLILNGLFLTQNALMPAGKVYSFSSASAVSSFFGLASTEAALASIYFAGYDNSTIKPGAMFFAPYNAAARSAWLQGGNVSSLTQAQWQALTGLSLTIIFDGYTRTAAAINISAAATQSAVATAIQTAINTGAATIATTTAGTIATTTLTVAGTVTGTFAPGQTLLGTSVTANSIILAQLTSTESDSHLGGKGTYQLSQSSTISVAAAMTTTATPVAVTWNSTQSCFVITSGVTGVASTSACATGTLAAGLGLTSATGAILSQGAVADTPASAMNNAVAITQNWASFITLFEPLLADKINFALWNQTQNGGQNYVYLAWDTDNQALVQGATTPFGVVAKAAAYNGVCCISGDPNIAAYNGTTLAAMLLNDATFIAGAIASVNFSAKNGHTDFMFRSQSGLVAPVRDGQLALNLIANGYNFYGAHATANQEFTFFRPGQISGKWKWLDSFIEQIWINSQFQLALMELKISVGATDYNEPGYAQLRSALMDPINAALYFAAIVTGKVLSSAQKTAINTAAGQSVDSIISSQGYYLQILDPGASARAARTSPIINFWYAGASDIQFISMNSSDVQ